MNAILWMFDTIVCSIFFVVMFLTLAKYFGKALKCFFQHLPQWMPNWASIPSVPLRSELWNDWQSWLSMAELHGCAVVFCDDHFEIYHNECQIWHWFYLTHLDLNCEMIGNHNWAWLSCMGVQWFSVMTTSKFTTMNAKFGIDSIWPT